MLEALNAEWITPEQLPDITARGEYIMGLTWDIGSQH